MLDMQLAQRTVVLSFLASPFAGRDRHMCNVSDRLRAQLHGIWDTVAVRAVCLTCPILHMRDSPAEFLSKAAHCCNSKGAQVSFKPPNLAQVTLKFFHRTEHSSSHRWHNCSLDGSEESSKVAAPQSHCLVNQRIQVIALLLHDWHVCSSLLNLTIVELCIHYARLFISCSKHLQRHCPSCNVALHLHSSKSACVLERSMQEHC